MTTPNLLADLRRDEGLRLCAYPDPLSGGAPFTIGYGHASPEIHAGLVWTEAHANAALAADLRSATDALDLALPWWRSLDDARQDVLANMAFNLGVRGLCGFGTFLGLVRQGRFGDAARDLAATDWAREVGARARRLIAQIATGVHQP